MKFNTRFTVLTTTVPEQVIEINPHTRRPTHDMGPRAHLRASSPRPGSLVDPYSPKLMRQRLLLETQALLDYPLDTRAPTPTARSTSS